MASYEIATASQTRQDYQNGTVDGLLKQVYIPALNNTVFHATPLMDMFGEFGGSIDFVGNKIIKAFKTQRAGGFGAISEGGDFVASKDQKGIQGWERIKYLNAYFSLTGPAAKTIRSGEGAYVDAVSSAMDDTLNNAKLQMERMIAGKANGVLLTAVTYSTSSWASGATTAMKIQTDNPDASNEAKITIGDGGYSPLQFIQEGMVVDFHTTLGTRLVSGTVSAVDYAAGTCTITPSASLTIGNSTTFYITLPYAYGQGETTSASGIESGVCLEMNGLYNLVSDGKTNGETTSNYAEIWNQTRSDYPHALKSLVIDAASQELDEELLIDWVLQLVNYKQSVPNVLVTDPKSRLKYFSNRKEDRRFDTTVIDTVFGFKSIGVVIDQYQLILQSLTSLRPGSLFLLNTNAFKFAKATGGFDWIQDGGQILRNKELSDAVFGTAVYYGNFVCEDPKGQLKAVNLAY